jgi:hypothetical protein
MGVWPDVLPYGALLRGISQCWRMLLLGHPHPVSPGLYFARNFWWFLKMFLNPQKLSLYSLFSILFGLEIESKIGIEARIKAFCPNVVFLIFICVFCSSCRISVFYMYFWRRSPANLPSTDFSDQAGFFFFPPQVDTRATQM